ncbi:uncharacterized protein Z519_03831 [Cladophialophora bantiana CBS 173.52]|uniref:Zn(2)-C6 fungal-type domain-containing protein n=1 Tax=Cladophialophora bantiana (strain ATCC 10958 / CBS 173.52 / CDC B-1940 / NIH 8579) TaxID=1442370 RepID=A0A0D2G9E0_CLAB1|nr:uncharacterized protein Z519_03831 [Cladophialophora bantiana CBS 173.52]KIW95247.1 hypothetical protein Z519_03831 [Cladophialophora bantiana CBS 173.52]
MASHPHGFFVTIVPAGVAVRRAHNKSRTGCFTCKIRHVKCGEEKPRCSNCVSKGRDCQYSASIKRWVKKQGKAAAIKHSPLGPGVEMSKVSASFTLHDLRLFHHFLCFAYPPLPLSNKSAWTQEVPQLSHHSEHLMNALLALAASHLSTLTGVDDDQCTALFHKGRAIAGLKDAFAKSNHSSVEYDVMLATCYALAFQSALVPESAFDFTTFVRGCALVTARIRDEGKQTIFNIQSSLSGSPTQHATLSRLGSASLSPGSRFQILLSKGMLALHAAHPCIEHTGTGQRFYRALDSTFSGFQVSPSWGYDEFLSYYAVWFKLAEAKEVFSPDAVSEVAFLLWAYFISLQLLITMLVVEITGFVMNGDHPATLGHSDAAAKMTKLVEWLCAIEAITPADLRTHLTWPALVSDEVLSGLHVPMVSKARVESKVEVLCNLGSRSHNVLGNLLELSASLANWTEDLLSSRSGNEESSGAKEGWRIATTQIAFGILDQMTQDRPIDKCCIPETEAAPFSGSTAPISRETLTNANQRAETQPQLPC